MPLQLLVSLSFVSVQVLTQSMVHCINSAPEPRSNRAFTGRKIFDVLQYYRNFLVSLTQCKWLVNNLLLCNSNVYPHVVLFWPYVGLWIGGARMQIVWELEGARTIAYYSHGERERNSLYPYFLWERKKIIKYIFFVDFRKFLNSYMEETPLILNLLFHSLSGWSLMCFLVKIRTS